MKKVLVAIVMVLFLATSASAFEYWNTPNINIDQFATPNINIDQFATGSASFKTYDYSYKASQSTYMGQDLSIKDSGKARAEQSFLNVNANLINPYIEVNSAENYSRCRSSESFNLNAGASVVSIQIQAGQQSSSAMSFQKQDYRPR